MAESPDFVALLFCSDVKDRPDKRDILGVIDRAQVRGIAEFYTLVCTHWIAALGEHEQRITLEIGQQQKLEFVKRFRIENPLETTQVLERIAIRSGPGCFADFRLFVDGQEVSRRILPILGFGS